MTKQVMQRLGRFFRLSTFSPKGLLAWAVVLSIVFLACHFAGLRTYATIISGTSPTGDITDLSALLLAVLYVLSYVSFAVVVPILTIAAAIFLGLSRIIPRGKQPTEATGNGR